MAYMDMSQIIGIFTAIVSLAVVSVLIINGDKTAKIIGSSGTAFANAVTSATHPMQAS